MNTVDKTAPKEIWLNVGDEGTYQDAVDAACGISWCQYKIDANDVKYVLASSQAATIAQLQLDNAYLKNSEGVLANNVTKLCELNTQMSLDNDRLITALKFYEGFNDSRISSIAQTALLT